MRSIDDPALDIRWPLRSVSPVSDAFGVSLVKARNWLPERTLPGRPWQRPALVHFGEARQGERWVVDGNLVTAAGVSAGIDMALWLVGELYGEEHARTVQHFIEYDPDPPFSYTT